MLTELPTNLQVTLVYERKNSRVAALREQAIQNVRNNALWLAGMLEVGGSAGAGVIIERPRRKEPFENGRLYVKFADNDLGRMQQLRDIVGIGLLSAKIYKNPNSGSYSIQTNGTKAADFINAIPNKYIPSRRSIAQLASIWDQLDAGGRVQAASEWSKNFTEGKNVQVNSTQYEQLVEKPEFVAGVIDSRGIIFLVRGGYAEGHGSPSIEIKSKNKALLDALCKKFGGSVKEKIRVGRGNDFSSLSWQIKGADAKALYTVVGKHIMLRRQKAQEIFEDKGANRKYVRRKTRET